MRSSRHRRSAAPRLMCAAIFVGLVAVSCSASAPVPEAAEPDASTSTAAAGFDLAFVLPAFPEDPDAPEQVNRPGQPVDPDHLNVDQFWLWCSGEPPDALATLVVGDIWQTLEGAGFIAEFSSSLRVGERYSFPIAREELVLFLVDVHGIAGIPEEYASAEEESYGSIVFDALPCGDSGDELAFTVDGGLGAETNPGFTSALSIEGSIRLEKTDDPPPGLFALDG